MEGLGVVVFIVFYKKNVIMIVCFVVVTFRAIAGENSVEVLVLCLLCKVEQNLH